MVFKNWKKEAKKLEQEDTPQEQKKPEVKKPGMWSKLVDSFGGGNRWEKELAYIEAQEEKETAAENERATEAVAEIAEEAETLINEETEETANEAESIVVEATEEAPELVPDAEAIQEGIRRDQAELLERIQRMQEFLDEMDAEKTRNTGKEAGDEDEEIVDDNYDDEPIEATGENTTNTAESTPTTETEKVMEKQMAGIKKLLEKKFPGETIDNNTADKIRIAIHIQNDKKRADFFNDADKIIDVYHDTLEENPTIGQQIEKISSTLKESGKADLDKKALHAVRRKIHEWNVADGDKAGYTDYFDNTHQINEAYKQVKEELKIEDTTEEVVEEPEQSTQKKAEVINLDAHRKEGGAEEENTSEKQAKDQIVAYFSNRLGENKLTDHGGDFDAARCRTYIDEAQKGNFFDKVTVSGTYNGEPRSATESSAYDFFKRIASSESIKQYVDSVGEGNPEMIKKREERGKKAQEIIDAIDLSQKEAA